MQGPAVSRECLESAEALLLLRAEHADLEDDASDLVHPPPVLAPGSALGSRPRVALSSAQVSSVYFGALRPCKSLLLGPGSPLCVGRRQLPLPLGPDCLGPTGQLVGRRDIGDRAMQA